MRICMWRKCNKRFRPANGNVGFCSEECRKEHHREYMREYGRTHRKDIARRSAEQARRDYRNDRNDKSIAQLPKRGASINQFDILHAPAEKAARLINAVLWRRIGYAG